VNTTPEVSSNPSPTPNAGQQETIDTSLEPASKRLRSDVWNEFKKMKVNGLDNANASGVSNDLVPRQRMEQIT
jgi:hypothetical protein